MTRPADATQMRLRLLDGLLVLGGTTRLNRAVVTDDVGEWFVKGPLYRWAGTATDRLDWRQKIASGSDCPYCIGTWIGFAVLSAVVTSSPRSKWGKLVRFTLAGLTLNEVAAHLGDRLGDFG